ncbi:MAG: DNA alkylation repair protein [Leptothrix sp. (in: b-proteobacteria)]
MSPQHYLIEARAALAPLADTERARQMRAYQRDQFDFLGIQTLPRRQAIATLGRWQPSSAELLATADLLWQLPQREYHYVAVDLLARHHKALGLEAIAALLALAQRHAWWDTVDGLAGVVGDVIHAARSTAPNPDPQRLMDAALQHDYLWVRRIAMIHQLGWRLDTDTERLFRYATALAPETDFFIRKAIGWALRDYARWDAPAVQAYVAANRAGLSGLTVREALKRVGAG